MIVYALIAALVLSHVTTAVVVVKFLGEIRPLVRAVIANNSHDLAVSDAAAEPRPVSRKAPQTRAEFVDHKVRPLGL